MVESIDVVLSTQLEVTAEAQIIIVRDHSSLEHLDYESSGHTGFASKDYTDTELDKKVDKIEGKGLSTNDFKDSDKSQIVSNKETIEILDERTRNLENDKVDIIEGKDLSTNDFTDDYRNKLDEVLVEENLTDAIDNEIYTRLLTGDTIKDELLPESVKNVIEFTKQVTGADFMAQILATDYGTTVWIAANKTYTGDKYYRKFAINTNGSEAGIKLFNPKENTIYVGKTDNNCYKWTGSNLVEISKGLSLGESTSTAYQGSKGKANADAIVSLQEASIINTSTIPTVFDNKTYRYIGLESMDGLVTGDLFRLKKEITEKERVIISKYPDILSSTSLPIIIKKGFKIVFNSDFTSNILYTATLYNGANGTGHFPQIQYAYGGPIYIIFNETGGSVRLHNSWNGGFVDSFSNEYVTWDKATRTLVYIGDEESVFDTLSSYNLSQADCTITTVERIESVSICKLSYVIPAPPTTAGTYKLQVVVDIDGNATYSWVE